MSLKDQNDTHGPKRVLRTKMKLMKQFLPNEKNKASQKNAALTQKYIPKQ
jgi:hypothetical protein